MRLCSFLIEIKGKQFKRLVSCMKDEKFIQITRLTLKSICLTNFRNSGDEVSSIQPVISNLHK